MSQPTVVLVHGTHRRLDGIGHNAPQEAPEAFTDAILSLAGVRA